MNFLHALVKREKERENVMNNPPLPIDKPHVPLAKFRVLYIGHAAPKATLDGIEAIQKPLCELYTKDDCQSRDTDVDVVLTILTSGLLMEPVNPLDRDLWLPIQNLQSCAAVKAVVAAIPGFGDCNNATSELSFVPIDSPPATGSPYPPIFSCVMGRSNGLPLNDCFAFICQSNDAAMLTVQAAMTAYGNKSGWASDRPSKAALSAAGQCSQDRVTISGTMDDTPSEFYERPPLSGFFYTPSPGLIQKFNIQGEACSYGEIRTPYIPPLPVPKPPPPANPPVNPMIFYGTEQETIFVDEPVRIQYPTSAVVPSWGSSQFSELGPSKAVAFNPYLVPVLDPPVSIPIQPPRAMPPPVVKVETTVVPREQIIMPPNDHVVFPMFQEQVTGVPPGAYGAEEPIYSKRLPRSNFGEPIGQTYSNEGVSSRQAMLGGGITARGALPSNDTHRAPFVIAERPTEELYAHRLPPQMQEPLPSGAMQFDPNFILIQSDTDKSRMADIENHVGYPVPRQVNIADFGY